MSAPAYDPNNVFAKILRGELPCHFVHEDADSFAFMDIMPRVDGHTLIIPKAPVRNILDASPAVLAPVIATAQRIAVAAKKAFDADGVSLWQFSEPAGGQVVFHLHFHILPRKTGDELRPLGIMADNDLLAKHAEKLKAALLKDPRIRPSLIDASN
ncbi:HIT family hydrolase [Rhodomicrobium udaipurense JA643]|uniref:HIT family protein n=1 Tax=Rhodomicrobium udaipurense TaxID=1202716 RepID=A0A8I1GI56_9HYPH|nr:HIT family protein [Rhodomicrobium udaipurense]KAI94460.1 HIT family hydrolase [Rhodomicrobium udaipurense JA643]MBJ7544666.1 HIT family protein [Rhodomicrobium udaipurense]